MSGLIFRQFENFLGSKAEVFSQNHLNKFSSKQFGFFDILIVKGTKSITVTHKLCSMSYFYNSVYWITV